MNCESAPESSPVSPSSKQLELSVAGEPPLNYLPYGVPAPDTLAPNTVPEPYDPQRHGPPLPNQMPHLNLAGEKGLGTIVPDRARLLEDRFNPPTSTPPAGSILNKGLKWTTDEGLTGVHETELNMNVPFTGDSVVVFAPTALPGGSACIEMSTIHRRYPQDVGGTVHHAGWWDWCDPSGEPESFEIEEDMENALWQDWYTVIWSPNMERGYYIQIVPDDSQGYPCWNGLIYNFNLGVWESKMYSCYPNGRNANWRDSNEGWSMWEGIRLEKICPNLTSTGAIYLRTLGPSGWRNIHEVAPSLSSGVLCWDASSSWSMDYTWDSTYGYWESHTPY